MDHQDFIANSLGHSIPMNDVVVGISAHYHDSAAAVVSGGKIIAAAQQERFSRKKHDSSLPTQAINYCLDNLKDDSKKVSALIYYEKPLLTFERLLETYIGSSPRGLRSFIKAMQTWLKGKIFLKSQIEREAQRIAHLTGQDEIPVLFSEHHLSHAAAAFYPSPFKDAAVLCMDGVGEWATTSAWIGTSNKLKPLWEISFPHSLGLLYSAFTYYCGFKVNSGEYKLMGLAPYGSPIYAETIKSNLIDIKPDGTFRLNLKFFKYHRGLRMTSHHFHQLFGQPARKAESELTQFHMDLAASIQQVTEEIVLLLAQNLHNETGCTNLCLAGGVALNCVANGRLQREGPFQNIWIQPASGDAGSALGAALVAWHQHFEQPRDSESNDGMQGTYLGPAFSNKKITSYLENIHAPFRTLEDHDLFAELAQLLDEGKVVGWFNGRMEFGPRSLGARSILGDPRNSEMQTTMNLKIKYRESFRPFAPAVLEEDAETYFSINTTSPYMLQVAPVHPNLCIPMSEADQERFGIDKLKTKRSSLPAITHVDYSARVQTVSQTTNPRFHALISAFKQRTGCPVLVNTSFNVRGEPIVCTPEDAYRCFMRTEMDVLVLENQILQKHEQPKPSESDEAWMQEFELD